jgi:hypothetical protein
MRIFVEAAACGRKSPVITFVFSAHHALVVDRTERLRDVSTDNRALSTGSTGRGLRLP